MKKNLPLLLIMLIVFQFTATAQVQWYQNQDGNNTYPNGTYATCIQSLTRSSFVSCYLWKTENDIYTWKISKSRYSGEEAKTFLISGLSASVEMKAGKRNSVYLLKKTYPPGSNAQLVLYKLDSNLNIRNEKTISFPGDFQVFNLNKFIVDESDNVYLAGDGQFSANGDFPLASFISKSDRHLNTQWSRFDTATTSFTDIQVDIHGRVYVIADHYSFFPDIHLYSYNRHGNFISKKILALSAERLNINTQLNDDNLFFYGMKSAENYEQAIYLSRYSLSRSVFKYNKTLYTAPGSILIDLKKDNDDNFLMLSMQYYANGDVKNRISNINSHYGAVHWQRSYLFANDSSNFTRIAVGSNNRFYIMGEKRTLNNNYTKGVAIRLNRHGFSDRRFNGPDSVAYQKSHWLTEGLVDREGDLISIGSTQDYDTMTYTGTYFRSFAVKFGNRRGDCRDNDGPGITSAEQVPEDISLTPSLKVFPNPVTIQLTISNIDTKTYNSFAVYNGQGAMLAKQTINSETEYFNTSKLTAGAYFILLQSNKGDAGNKKIQFSVSR